MRFRIIAVPIKDLLKVQQWITQSVLSKVRPHDASVAFSKGDTIYAAALPHCGCKWLLKLDVCNFFESINEIAAYKVFRQLGYQPLISFEMGRLCTRLGGSTLRRNARRWRIHRPKWSSLPAYDVWHPDGRPTVGHLPQGAPTSPMLANLAAREFDHLVSDIAKKYGLVYTRYADDIALSTMDVKYGRNQLCKVVREVASAMARCGLEINATKTQIATPGARKIVLGLLVDGPRPRLSRDFRANIRQHIYYVSDSTIGPAKHAKARGFASVIGLRNHLDGMLAYAQQVDPDYVLECKKLLSKVVWPI